MNVLQEFIAIEIYVGYLRIGSATEQGTSVHSIIMLMQRILRHHYFISGNLLFINFPLHNKVVCRLNLNVTLKHFGQGIDVKCM